MRIAFRLATAGLLVCLAFPHPVTAGGEFGQDSYEIGEQLFAKKHYATALKYYAKALAQNDMRAHYRMGLAYEAIGSPQNALYHYRLFIDLGPQDAQHRDAVQRAGAIEERLKRESRRTTELFERGKSLFKKGKYREAEKALLHAASRDQKRPETHFYLGEVYLKLEAYDKAAAEYKKAKGYY